MTLNRLIEQLQALQAQGHGTKQVFYRHGASGDCGPLGSAHVSNHIDECGPFDVDEDEEYISIYAGN